MFYIESTACLGSYIVIELVKEKYEIYSCGRLYNSAIGAYEKYNSVLLRAIRCYIFVMQPAKYIKKNVIKIDVSSVNRVFLECVYHT